MSGEDSETGERECQNCGTTLGEYERFCSECGQENPFDADTDWNDETTEDSTEDDQPTVDQSTPSQHEAADTADQHEGTDATDEREGTGTTDQYEGTNATDQQQSPGQEKSRDEVYGSGDQYGQSSGEQQPPEHRQSERTQGYQQGQSRRQGHQQGGYQQGQQSGYQQGQQGRQGPPQSHQQGPPQGHQQGPPQGHQQGGKEKDPGIAAVLSFLITGAGQLYNGQVGKAILLFVVQIVNFFLLFLLIGFLLLPAVWLFGIYDAYTQAKQINQQATGY